MPSRATRKDQTETKPLSGVLFTRAFRVSPAALWLSELDTGRAIDINESFVRITGYERDEVVGKTTLSLGIWADPKDRARMVETLREQGFVRDMEFRFQCRSGELRDGLLSAEIVDFRGEQCLLVYCSDITERNRATEELNQYIGRANTMHQLDRAILASQSTDAIAREAMRFLKELVPCSRIDILLIDSVDNTARMLASECSDEATMQIDGAKVSLDDMAITGDYRSGKAEMVRDISRFRNRSPYLKAALEGGLRSHISVPLVSRSQLVGALNLWANEPGVFTDTHLDIAYEVAYELTIGMQNARLLAEVSTGREELQSLSRRLLEIQENERRHIARELHDEIGQALTAVQMNIEALKQSPQGRRIGARLDESVELIDRVLQQVRDLSLDLRPSMLDDLGLVSALVWYAQRHSERPGLEVQLAFDPIQARLPSNVETACFRITQEAMTNILRHSQATLVRIELRLQGQELELTIRDNGRGFDVRSARSRAVGGGSMGLLSMEERAELLGGRLTIESKEGEGTLVKATLPIQPAALATSARAGASK